MNEAKNVEFMQNTMGRKLIYVFEKPNDEDFKGLVKIGDTSIDKPDSNLETNSPYLKKMAEERIREYEHSSKINILYATLAVDNNWTAFRDYQVHEVLVRSGYSKITMGRSTEWFKIDEETAIDAIDAVKKGEYRIHKKHVEELQQEILFRPEQEEAIEKTRKILKFKKYGNEMLWYAKMRFGKTLCALEVIKREQVPKTLIITHRPIVDDGWYDDYKKIFEIDPDNHYVYSSKNRGEKKEVVLNPSYDKPFIYFTSIQDLRGSNKVNQGKGFNKNDDVFNIDWDFVIIDEAHEGTQTQLAKAVKNEIIGKETKVLELSGTPFNILDKYDDEDKMFTWSYIDEQEAKQSWDKIHEGDSNPYGDMPQIQMYVYELTEMIKNNAFIDIENKSFNFAEFFRLDDNDQFIYEKEIISFLNIITDTNTDHKYTNMPFTNKYRDEIRHTIWTMPTRKSAVALEKLLKQHPIFKDYNIANLTSDAKTENDIDKIRKAITDKPEESYSITLTVRKGTVGTTIPEWSAILVLNNTDSATNYLQSIFRVQSPYLGKNGQKEKAYVFDFAPDRSLKLISQAVKLNTKEGTINSPQQKQEMEKLLNFLPIIGIDGNQMKEYNFQRMMIQLKRLQAEKAVRSGFDDKSIYSDELLKLTRDDINAFNDLREILGQNNKQNKKIDEININNQGMTDEEYENAMKGDKKPKRKRTKEEQEALDKREQLLKQKDKLISILRGMSIRIPLMIYGMDIELDDDVTIDNFAQIVDDISWNEFMPKGVTKEKFNQFKKYYDAEIFIEAGKRIRRTAQSADTLPIEERIDKITSMFQGFRNPDKETVLTPWRVVNMQLGESIGGYNFYEDKYQEKDPDNKIRYIDKKPITDDIFKPNTKILEINSKTGLYPLYMAYTLYKKRKKQENPYVDSKDWNKKLWREILEKNIYVLNKTPMAKTITYRTLNGYEKNPKIENNLIYVDNLVDKVKNDLNSTAQEVLEKFGDKTMKFDIVVGNPPYQLNDNGKRENGTVNASASAIYPDFFCLAKKLSKNKINMIFPAKWLSGAGKGTKSFNKEMINDTHIRSMTFFKESKLVFPNTDIKGGVLYLTYDKKYDGEADIKMVLDDKDEKNQFTNYLNSINKGIFIPYGGTN